MSIFSGVLSGASSSGGSSGIWGDVFKSVLGGISSYAGAKSSGKQAEKMSKLEAETALKIAQIQGLEARKKTAFEKDLEYYYKQQDNRNKRLALDSYGAFSKLSTFAPQGFTLPAVPVVPPKPAVGGY